MSPRGWRKYPRDDLSPLVVEPMTTAGPQPWHARALALRAAGVTIRAIARELGVGFGPVQRLLNPASKAKQKQQENERTKALRKSDARYAATIRTYVRKHMQITAKDRYVSR